MRHVAGPLTMLALVAVSFFGGLEVGVHRAPTCEAVQEAIFVLGAAPVGVLQDSGLTKDRAEYEARTHRLELIRAASC